MSDKVLWIIQNPKSTEKELLAAIRSLPKRPTESPQFWTQIANSQSYRHFRRSQAIGQLFKRHVKVGMKLQDLARVLNYPRWLKPEDVDEVVAVMGYIPVKLVGGDTTISIVFLRDAVKYGGAIYLRVHKEVSIPAFINLLLGKGNTQIGKNVIAEIGYGRNWAMSIQ